MSTAEVSASVCYALATPEVAGAVAILELAEGQQADGALRQLLQQLTGRQHWQEGLSYLVDLGGVDQGLATVFNNGQFAQLMPHGGLRVIESLCHLLQDLGAQPSASEVALAWPEASSPLQARVLALASQLHSPIALSYLARQPQLQQQASSEPVFCKAFKHAIKPASVVLVGPPNSGKSTLLNHLLGRTAAIVSDQAGTTRDWVTHQVQLFGAQDWPGGLVVHWTDTPGVRETEDQIEAEAIARVNQLCHGADVLIAIRCPDTSFSTDLPRQPDLYVQSQAERLPEAVQGDGSKDAPLHISVHAQAGLEQLQQAVLGKLGWWPLPAEDALWDLS